VIRTGAGDRLICLRGMWPSRLRSRFRQRPAYIRPPAFHMESVSFVFVAVRVVKAGNPAMDRCKAACRIMDTA
jgi:hypothetical protein